MDIIDIMLARAMTPQGKTEAYVAKANRAAAKAEKAKGDAEDAVATVNAAAEDIAETQEAASSLLSDAREALETAQAAQINIPDTEDIDAEVKKLVVNTNVVNGQTANTLQIISTYPDNTLNTQNITKLYKSTGNNEDGAMTQKAITDALSLKADASALNAKADKSYVDTQIAAIPTSSSTAVANTNLGSENEGKIVIVGSDGDITPGAISEEDLVEALLANGGYAARNAVGLTIDYDNKTFIRTQQAEGKSMGTDFDQFIMYGGRKRCLVNDDGSIYAFEGEADFRKSSDHQTMIYQPKFYYQRVPLQTEGNRVGKIINKDSIVISSIPQSGFKVHPAFIDANGEELDYILLSAFEGGVYSAVIGGNMATTYNYLDTSADKMISVPNTKPITGSYKLNLEKAEQIARNRGTGWHIMTMQAESVNQMLEIIEFGTMNGQSVLGKGISDIETVGNQNQSALTGSTFDLGSASGSADETIFELDGERTTLSGNGKVAISYRGFENPWGNTWSMIGNIFIHGDSAVNGGVPYICKNFNYAYENLTNNYESVGFSLPNNNGWISAMGYGEKKYDWVLMPAASSNNANSALPIGDNGWFDSNLNGNRMAAQGGSWSFGESNGQFYYACDKQPTDSQYKSYGARLMFIPTKNSIYNANIAKWQALMED